MPRAKTIVELLAEQPAEELVKMRDANQRELARARAEVTNLELQERLIEAALSKRGKPGRPGKLTATAVLGAVVAIGTPGTAADVHEALSAVGLDVSVNAVRNHLNRLVETRDLEKDENKRYSIPGPVYVPAEFVPGAGASDDFPAIVPDEDIPF